MAVSRLACPLAEKWLTLLLCVSYSAVILFSPSNSAAVASGAVALLIAPAICSDYGHPYCRSSEYTPGHGHDLPSLLEEPGSGKPGGVINGRTDTTLMMRW